MKRSIMLGMVLVTILVSLGGCFVGYPEHDRDGRHDRDERHGHDRSDMHYHDRDGEHDERR